MTRYQASNRQLRYNEDAMTYWGGYADLITPARRKLDSELFVTLEANGLLSGFDGLWVFAHEIQGLAYRNLIKRAHDCTAVNAPTWTANQGSQGNGSSSYLNTNYRPNTHKVNLSLNSGSIFVYIRTGTNANTVDIGSQTGASSQRLDILGRTTSNTSGGSVNQSIGQAFASAAVTGLLAATRTASNVFTIIKNGAVIGSNATASSGINDKDVYVHARNSGTAPELFSARQIAIAGVGRGFSNAEHATLFTVLEAYLDSFGAGVI